MRERSLSPCSAGAAQPPPPTFFSYYSSVNVTPFPKLIDTSASETDTVRVSATMFPTQRLAPSLHYMRVDVLLLIVCCTLLVAITIFKSESMLTSHPFEKISANQSSTPTPIQADIVSDPLQNLSKRQRSVVEKQQHVDYRSIWMGELEINLVLTYMHEVQTYMEWGSGGSTYNFPQFANRSYSIEHDQTWCSKMIQGISSRPELKRLQYHCVPIPRGTNGWGLKSPFEEGSYKQFKPYIDHIEKLGEKQFDVVLIDGRARVDAAIKALSYIGKNSVVIIHDAERIWTYRTYASMSAFYDIIDSVGGMARQGLAVMRRKPKYSHLQGNHSAVQEILDNKYRTTRKTANLTRESESSNR